MTAMHVDVSNLDLFAFNGCGRIRWISVAESAALDARGRRKVARLPLAGELAGGKMVHGRGRLVSCRGHRLITGDIASALRRDHVGVDWPWQAGALPAAMPLDMLDRDAADMATSSWYVRTDGALAWARSPHVDHPVGSIVAGTVVAGGRVVVSTRSVGFLVDDVKYLLTHGRWPWEPENDCFSVDWD